MQDRQAKLERSERQRGVAREIFLRALEGTSVEAAVERSVRCDGKMLSVGGREYDLDRYSEMCIVSIGKAGGTLFDAVDAVLPRSMRRRAVVSAPAPPKRMGADVQYFRGGHPEPDAASFDAARAAVEAVRQSEKDALVMFLVSGGASAMCELPISESVSLEDVVRLNRLLIGSGASIAEINCVRKHLSLVKGGRLAVAAGEREKITLLVSDVPDNALDALGSGPSLPDSSTVADCLSVIARYGLWERLPASVQACVEAGLEESPKAEETAFRNAAVSVLLGNQTILENAQRIARGLGYDVQVDSSCDDWDYEDAATYLLAKLATMQRAGRKACLISGGEVTVRLPNDPGVGGRNLQFCLFCATQDLKYGTTVLSAGTDGIDGSSGAAGGVVDATTGARGEEMGLRMDEYLWRFDAYRYLEPLGDAIVTGATGNNLRDVRILLWEDAER